MNKKFYCVYLGGSANKSNTELHDIVFVAGNSIKETYFQLLEKWFGDPDGLHIDSYFEIKIIDGFEIQLSEEKVNNEYKLYFVNLGAYDKNIFGEIHSNSLVAAKNLNEAKKLAKQRNLTGKLDIHTDNIFEVDKCFEVSEVGEYYINLIKTDKKADIKYVNEYHPLPEKIISEYKNSL